MFLKFLTAIFLTSTLLMTVALAEEEKVVLAMGDSLMAGYNLPPNQGFPHQLEDWLQEQGLNIRVINAGVSGDTTTAALERLEWTLAGAPNGKPDLFIVEFGGNDMLRGIDPSLTRRNLDAILKLATERNIKVLFTGMLAAPNMGPDYRADFDAIYPELAEKYNVNFYPFFLEGVAGQPGLNLGDGIHPNVKGVGVMVENLGPVIEGLLND
ncbi:MAG: arylesterase [Sphingomonadales bacterium]